MMAIRRKTWASSWLMVLPTGSVPTILWRVFLLPAGAGILAICLQMRSSLIHSKALVKRMTVGSVVAAITTKKRKEREDEPRGRGDVLAESLLHYPGTESEPRCTKHIFSLLSLLSCFTRNFQCPSRSWRCWRVVFVCGFSLSLPFLLSSS